MTSGAIEFEDVTITYAGEQRPAVSGVDFALEQGELAVLVGRTGSGKSTVLGAINGLVPHFTGGLLEGHVRVHGRDTRDHLPREMADLVGYVGQDPLAGFVTDTVEQELAYGMEQFGIAPAVMRKRVEETLDLLGIADLRHMALRDLSGGQQQRVAIGSVLTLQPQVLVLDEPTSALDPTGAEEVLATITRLVHDLSVTVVMAEHRIERVLQYADTLIHVARDGLVEVGTPAEIMQTATVAPPVVVLGRDQGWMPLPLSVRDARRRARSLHAELEARPIPADEPATGPVALQAKGIRVNYDVFTAVRDVDMTLQGGVVSALMGRNGSGKSSLMWALQGAVKPTAGRVTVTTDGTQVRPGDLSAPLRRKHVGLVPQSAGDLLYLDTVAAECAQADVESGAEPGTCEGLLLEMVPDIVLDRHPRDLSEGQRLAVVLAVQLTARPSVVLLDEPTRGLDYAAKAALRRTLHACASRGQAVLVSSHDVEFVAETADEVVFMADGDVVASGTTAQVLLGSPAFAPQVAKILAPLPLLTVDQVRAARS
ncbi:ABC transporter ATP-binding protein [Yimella sp. cx-51]|uniref:ABC transporter ATP-binding protein n=1 Tax=Yimella sp. cx-51 TaxID=2770551 RepID=UPI00165E9967|nr:ATP-binding cassette domain-containing protein [Yimella sp. cx-51]MBC9957159.1 ABC transporter ATP-binding protein [Yimella sp. cx-51]QTH37191.1 ABC transporter ATP-binding protein [Yimella sp. cx-51]